MPLFEIIAFDADDTLWQNELYYNQAQEQLRKLLAPTHSPETVDSNLFQTEMRNLPFFGYGLKSFALSMIETAVSLTNGRITGSQIQTIIDLGKELIPPQMELLEGVEATVAQLSQTMPLMIITKGDLLDQETKVARSGIAQQFQHVEILSDKSPASYRRILERYKIQPERFLMVGNSLRSDILPLLDIGATAVYIPNVLTWSHELSGPTPAGRPGYYELTHIGLLPDLITELEQNANQAATL